MASVMSDEAVPETDPSSVGTRDDSSLGSDAEN